MKKMIGGGIPQEASGNQTDEENGPLSEKEAIEETRTALRESLLREKKSEFKKLEKNKVKLTPEERAECMERKCVWHFHIGKKGNHTATPAVWKSVDPKTGKTTYITNTHRAYNTAPTLKGAISRFFKFIKSTA